MKNNITFSLLCIILPCLVCGQTYNTKNAYLITTIGDTLHGVIRDRADLSKEISFKVASDVDFKNYTPDNISAFYIDPGYYYEAKTVESQKVFLQALAKGPLSLYQESSETVFFIQKDNGVLRKLEKRDSLIEGIYRIDTRYRNVLNAFTSDCPQSKRSVDRANLSNRDLLRIVKEYNQCVSPTDTSFVFTTSTKISLKKGIKAGWLLNKMEAPTETGAYRGASAPSESSISGGIFLRLYYKEKWAAQPEVLFTKKSGTLDGRTVFGTGDIGVFSFTYLQIPLSIYYIFPTKKIKPFVFGGAVAGFPLSYEAYRIKADQQLPIAFDLDPGEIGYRGGTGAEWQLNHSLALQLEYLYESALTNRFSVTNKLRNTSHSIKLGIAF